MSENLSWSEIREKYPNMWVALDNVKYVNDDGINVESADVVCAMKDEEYSPTRLKFMQEGRKYEYERTENSNPLCGVLF